MDKPATILPVKTFLADQLSVRVYARGDDLALEAARAAAGHLRQTLSQQDRASVIFACATSQVGFLKHLVALNHVEWKRIIVFHMDEYLGLPAEHPASFRRFLREHLIQRIRPAAVHYLEGDASQPLDECERYARLLSAQPIDLVCAGIGENGHLAFNDPPVAHFSDPRQVKLVKLDEACRRQQVGEGCFPELSAVPQYALTLTIPRLCATRKLLCIVPEQRKAAAVKQALQGPVQTTCPASFLRQQAHAVLYLDTESASGLQAPAVTPS